MLIPKSSRISDEVYSVLMEDTYSRVLSFLNVSYLEGPINSELYASYVRDFMETYEIQISEQKVYLSFIQQHWEYVYPLYKNSFGLKDPQYDYKSFLKWYSKAFGRRDNYWERESKDIKCSRIFLEKTRSSTGVYITYPDESVLLKDTYLLQVTPISFEDWVKDYSYIEEHYPLSFHYANVLSLVKHIRHYLPGLFVFSDNNLYGRKYILSITMDRALFSFYDFLSK